MLVFSGGDLLNTIKHIVSLILCAILLVAVAGCSYEGSYAFRQEVSNICKVEILTIDDETDTKNVIVELSDEDGQLLVAELATMTCDRFGPGDHPRRYGQLAIGITYTDGEIEIIGLVNSGFVDTDGREYLLDYFFDAKELYVLITKYVDPSLLPDVSKDYPSWYWNSTANTSEPT